MIFSQLVLVVAFVLCVDAHEVEEDLPTQLRGGAGRSLSGWSSPPCLLIKCIDPCPEYTCQHNEKCVTKKTYSSGCPGCPVFEKCKKKRPVCPRPSCADPCEHCDYDETCKTKATFLHVGGRKCPACPTLIACEPKWSPPEKCGKTTCQDGYVCCNASCGICTRPGGVCTQEACVDDLSTKCGRTTCGKGLVCCNASCGICTPPNGACTQQVCDYDY
jgi:hypothetical protein